MWMSVLSTTPVLMEAPVQMKKVPTPAPAVSTGLGKTVRLEIALHKLPICFQTCTQN